MRSFVSYVHQGEVKAGFFEAGKLYSLPYRDMRECVAAGFLSGKKKEMDQKRVRLTAPIIPPKIVCLGWNYKAHNKELAAASDNPIVFLKPPSSVIGPGEKIILPKISKQVEHEIELGVVIGRDGKDIPKDKAFDHVAGYTIILDITARDLQWEARRKGDPWDICKGFDSFAPMGPGIVPKKYVKDPGDLDMELKVNGVTRQRSNTSDMINAVDDVIAYVSSFFTLKVGDMIATGTPEGVGPLAAGDRVDAWIEGIGSLSNPVSAE